MAQDIRQYSPLTLAFLGDAVYELFVRDMIVGRGQRPAKALHKDKVRYVNAKAQARVAAAIEPMLDETEADMMRRGRSTRVGSSAKNASLSDYHRATGLEALCGYLYMTGASDRLRELLERGFEVLDES